MANEDRIARLEWQVQALIAENSKNSGAAAVLELCVAMLVKLLPAEERAVFRETLLANRRLYQERLEGAAGTPGAANWQGAIGSVTTIVSVIDREG